MRFSKIASIRVGRHAVRGIAMYSDSSFILLLQINNLENDLESGSPVSASPFYSVGTEDEIDESDGEGRLL